MHDNISSSTPTANNINIDENNDEIYESSDSDDFEDGYEEENGYLIADDLSDNNNNNIKMQNNFKIIHNKINNKKAKVTVVKNASAASPSVVTASSMSLKKTNQKPVEENTKSAFCVKLNKSMSKYAHDPDFPCLDFKNSDQSLKLEVNLV